MKRFLTILLACAIFAGTLPISAAQSSDNSFFKLTATEDFSSGKLENVILDEKMGDGAVVLADGATSGTFESGEITVPAFEYMVASWNVSTPGASFVEVEARAFIDMKGAWSDWLSYGKWGQGIKRGSPSPESELAKISTDTFTVLGSNGETSSKLQLRVTFTADGGNRPALRLLSASMKNTLDGQAISVFGAGGAPKIEGKAKLDTPAYSQMIREYTIANIICSPTTVTTLLNDKGENLLPEEVALNCFDYLYDGFGNWSYSIAAAGAMGYEAYVRYGDFDLLRTELDKGYPVGLSVSYSNEQGGQYAFLEGAPMSTGGHIITITGYETVDGVEYFYSSDSAATTDQNAFLRYRADQLDGAWQNRLCYIVHDREDGAEQTLVKRSEAQLKLVDGTADRYKLYAADGAEIAIPTGFTASKTKNPGGGIIAYTYKNAESTVNQEGAVTTLANMPFKYSITAMPGGELKISADSIIPEGKTSADIEVYLVTNSGNTYVAQLTLTAAADAVGTADSEGTGSEVEPQENSNKKSQLYIMTIIALTLVAVGTALFYIRSRNKKK